ncbi:MAG: hypothetical protein ACFFDS_05770 [Candidatus Thorarchaeota archaeon]
MPQLVKGGKYVFGWSKINPNGKIKIPEEASSEYKIEINENLIIFNGSKKSGGFGVSKPETLKSSPIGSLLKDLPKLIKFEIPEGQIIKHRNRKFCWTNVNEHGYFILSSEALKTYDLKIGNKLIVGRGSYLAIAFIAKGPIFEEAKKHSKLILFE